MESAVRTSPASTAGSESFSVLGGSRVLGGSLSLTGPEVDVPSTRARFAGGMVAGCLASGVIVDEPNSHASMRSRAEDRNAGGFTVSAEAGTGGV